MPRYMHEGISPNLLEKVQDQVMRPHGEIQRPDPQVQENLKQYLKALNKNISSSGFAFSKKAVDNIAERIAQGKFSLNEVELIVGSLLELETFKSVPDEAKIQGLKIPFRTKLFDDGVEKIKDRLTDIREEITKNLDEGKLDEVFPLISSSFSPLMEICKNAASASPIKFIHDDEKNEIRVIEDGEFKFSRLKEEFSKNFLSHISKGNFIDALLWLRPLVPKTHDRKEFIPLMENLSNLIWYALKSGFYSDVIGMIKDPSFTVDEKSYFLPGIVTGTKSETQDQIQGLIEGKTKFQAILRIIDDLKSETKENLSNPVINGLTRRFFKRYSKDPEELTRQIAQLKGHILGFLGNSDRETLSCFYDQSPNKERILDYLTSEDKNRFGQLEGDIEDFSKEHDKQVEKLKKLRSEFEKKIKPDERLEVEHEMENLSFLHKFTEVVAQKAKDKMRTIFYFDLKKIRLGNLLTMEEQRRIKDAFPDFELIPPEETYAYLDVD